VYKTYIIKLVYAGSQYASLNFTEKMLLVQFSITFLNNIEARSRADKISLTDLLDYTAKMTVDNAVHTLFIHDLRAGYDLAPAVIRSKILIK
jgi:hypothetical protein